MHLSHKHQAWWWAVKILTVEKDMIPFLEDLAIQRVQSKALAVLPCMMDAWLEKGVPGSSGGI